MMLLICMLSALTFWYWTAICCVLPRENHLSPSQSYLAPMFFFCVGLWLHRLSCHFGMFIGVLLVQ